MRKLSALLCLVPALALASIPAPDFQQSYVASLGPMPPSMLEDMVLAQAKPPYPPSSGTVRAVTAANGLSLSGSGTLALAAAGAAAAGAVTTGAQSFAGVKSFVAGPLPAADNTLNLGSSSFRWAGAFIQLLKDGNSVNRITFNGGGTTAYQGGAANGATAVGHTFNTSAAYTTAGALVLKFQNNAVDKATIDKDGSYAFLASPTLETCAAGIEGKVTRQAGGTGGTRTHLCMCTSDGAGTPAYAWARVDNTASVGTTTTCP